MNNIVVRKLIKDSGLHYWQIAEKLGMEDTTFSKKLRHELTDELKTAISEIVKDLVIEKADVCSKTER